jgi:transcription elongation factor Elf1
MRRKLPKRKRCPLCGKLVKITVDDKYEEHIISIRACLASGLIIVKK